MIFKTYTSSLTLSILLILYLSKPASSFKVTDETSKFMNPSKLIIIVQEVLLDQPDTITSVE